ncbi:MAG: bifunctional phosphoribosylaminoimidazolecarboxamide formyltransferase/IMP cyclohydrolase [Myxococcota bacterium]
MAAIQRALISVSDKSGIAEFGKALKEHGVEILSTGGTARALREAGIEVTDVAEYTESPEVMDGRVKTLHPRVHGAILMRDQASDHADLETLGGRPIDLVVVNLYPFEATVAANASFEDTIEKIDIGGPSMVRSAAKNHARVTVVVDPTDYAEVTGVLAEGASPELRARFAAKAFQHTAAYDGAIAGYLSSLGDGQSAEFPGTLTLQFQKAYDCRYGENPHQRGAFYIERNAPKGSLALAEPLGAGGKELSFNNLVDLDATLEAVREFTERPAAVVVKHTNPCGVAEADDLETAFRTARAADSVSAFGGIVALNRPCDEPTAAAVTESFIECIVAPSFEGEALALLRKKKNLRILAAGELPRDHAALAWKRIGGGLVVQNRDAQGAGEARNGKVVSERAPTDEEMAALEFGWKVCKHVKSNAIVFAKPGRTVGVGAGQMSRVVSVQLAGEKAGDESRGAVMASDAFFPFPDGVEAAAKVGITAVVQPGGSKRDDEVIAAANAAGMAMVLTGARHFRH